MVAHISAIVSATSLPVSGDLENGFGDSPEIVAETISLAAAAGLVGGSIEDSTGLREHPIYEKEHAVDRIRAAAEAAHALPFPFTLTARAENFIAGNPSLKDTIQRLQAFQAAGADVLYAPGLISRSDISSVVSSLDRPLNVLMGLQGVKLSQLQLSAIGVKRISVGSALSRAALGAAFRAAQEMRDHGTFIFAEDALPNPQLNSIFHPWK